MNHLVDAQSAPPAPLIPPVGTKLIAKRDKLNAETVAGLNLLHQRYLVLINLREDGITFPELAFILGVNIGAPRQKAEFFMEFKPLEVAGLIRVDNSFIDTQFSSSADTAAKTAA